MTTSYWERTSKKEVYAPLDKDQETEVLIVGGGLTGLMTAWNLMQAGKKAVVVEARTIGSGVSGNTTAHLNSSVDCDYHIVAKNFGKDTAKLVAEAAVLGIELVGQVDKAHNLDANYQKVPAYIYAETTDQILELQKELKAAKEAGLDVEEVEEIEGLNFPTGMVVRFNRNARFHPLKFLYGLTETLREAGVQIYEQTRVEKHNEKDDYVEVTLSTGATVKAKHVVLATHSPIFMHPVHTRMAPYRSYAIAIRTRQPVPDALIYDMRDPYNYVRKEEDNVVIIGGADHKTGQTGDENQHLQNIKAWAEERFGIAEYLASWSAQVFEPADNLPFIGKSVTHKRVYYGTGYSGDGTLWGSFAGYLLSDIILGKENKFAELFSPARLNIKAEAGEFLKENLNVAKEFIKERFSSDASDVKEISNGDGKILRQGLQQYAVYRDDQGGLHVMSPTCVHMGCVVQWNKLEKTWDCPCHGGRYKATGEQLSGPPATGLRKAEM
jgi:glycine/D-amino acid oxidase-like deaminating enzyme/nitrite reductase/ring-hydroxylating ferredoxin subunit